MDKSRVRVQQEHGSWSMPPLRSTDICRSMRIMVCSRFGRNIGNSSGILQGRDGKRSAREGGMASVVVITRKVGKNVERQWSSDER
jgi:hypothetical protein